MKLHYKFATYHNISIEFNDFFIGYFSLYLHARKFCSSVKNSSTGGKTFIRIISIEETLNEAQIQ